MGDCYIVRRGGGISKLPAFTYTGDYAIVDDGSGDWRVKFLTSGTLTFTKNPGSIDVFLVGGGGSGYGSGGGGGYTKTQKGIAVELNKPYTIIVGAGGSGGTYGGATSAFSATANGGKSSGTQYPSSGNYQNNGADGGSGGGATAGGAGGSDGSDGGAVTSIGAVGGIGQHTTTREFGETTGDLYAGGGGGRYVQGLGNSTPGKGGAGGGGDGSATKGINGVVNTGGGGGGGPSDGSGGSGIVIIRNSRG